MVAQGAKRALRGSPAWVAVTAGAWLWRRSRSRREPRPVWTEDLAPGQAVVITHHVAAGS